MKRFKELVREAGVEPVLPSSAADTLKQKQNKEPIHKLKEGRMSQRHPLEGHDYHKKSNGELVNIAKDAHAAAEAMKSHNTQAENKYRDQANDSATVRYWRQKNGMPEWYKKKYGHMKEEMDTTEKMEMVQSQLHFMKYACEEILEYVEKGGEVEEWYQVKIAKVFAEFEGLHSYMEGESRRTGMKESNDKFAGWVAFYNGQRHEIQKHQAKDLYDAKLKAIAHFKVPKSKQGLLAIKPGYNEEVELDEAMTPMQKLKDALDRHTEKSIQANKRGDDVAVKVHQGYMNKIKTKMGKLAKNEEVELGEEVEILDEISKNTLGSYIKKAAYNAQIHAMASKDIENRGGGYTPDSLRHDFKRANRSAGIVKAVNRLTKEDVSEEEVNIIAETYRLPNDSEVEKLQAHVKAKHPNKTLLAAAVHRKTKHIEYVVLDKKNKTSSHTLGEEVEQIDEIAQDTMRSYVHKSFAHGNELHKQIENEKDPVKKAALKAKLSKRNTGIITAGKKIREDVDQLDELSKDTMKSYREKAHADMLSSAGKAIGAIQKKDKPKEIDARFNWEKRIRGINTVDKKLKKEDVEYLEEKNKPTNPELWSRAVSMAKQKFDVYPSAYANGWAAKWYKSKGGDWKSVSEGVDDAIEKIRTEEKPPFDPDKQPKKKAVAGKYGIGYSTAKHLAKMALKKQTEKLKPVRESLDESRKTEIVRELVKKKKNDMDEKDKFEREPIMTNTISKE